MNNNKEARDGNQEPTLETTLATKQLIHHEEHKKYNVKKNKIKK